MGVLVELAVTDPVPALNTPAVAHQFQQGLWGGAQAGEKQVGGLKRSAVTGAGSGHLHNPAGANPALADVRRCLLCPQHPGDVPAMAELLMPSVNYVGDRLSNRRRTAEKLHNPNVVKVLLAADGRGLYFSRSALPHVRDVDPAEWCAHTSFWGHVGIYAYRADVLLRGPLRQGEAGDGVLVVSNRSPWPGNSRGLLSVPLCRSPAATQQTWPAKY